MVAAGSQRSVVPAYRMAAQQWYAGEDIYSGDGRGFIYLPQAAVLFGPFAILPPILGDVLWRVVTVGTFALGVYRLAAVVRPDQNVSLFPLATCVALPMAWDGARNGQSTLPMAGFLMIAVADAAARRWTRAAVWLALGLAIKPLAAVGILLMGAIHREMRARLLTGLVVVAALPSSPSPRRMWSTSTRPACIRCSRPLTWESRNRGHSLSAS